MFSYFLFSFSRLMLLFGQDESQLAAAIPIVSNFGTWLNLELLCKK